MKPPSASSLDELSSRLGRAWPNIVSARESANDAINRIEEAIRGTPTEDTSLVVFGSLARQEFTSGSDVDWSLLVDGQSDPAHLTDSRFVAKAIKAIGLKDPGKEGTFGAVMFSHDLIHYIGGGDDDNANTTRRLLLLLESSPVGRREAYDRTVRNVLHRYIYEDFGWLNAHSPISVPRFLLNDISRFWRTMAVDFAYKRWNRAGEGWALRTAKLRLSRKLLYVSGLAICFSCALDPEMSEMKPDPSNDEAISAITQFLSRFIGVPPLAVVAHLLLSFPELDAASAELFDSYDAFIALLNDASKRNALSSMEKLDATTNDLYEEVRQIGSKFQGALTGIFMSDGSDKLRNLTVQYGVF